jgi:hypothetical protein
MKFPELCLPSILYLIISLITIIVFAWVNFSFLTILFKLLWALIWSWFLNWICSTGHPGVAWGIFLFPYILIIFTLLIVIEIYGNADNKKKTVPIATQK